MNLVTNNTTSLTNLLPAEAEKNNTFKNGSFLLGCLMIPLVCVGLVTNVLCMYVYSRPHMMSFINTLLAGLAFSDLVLFITGSPVFIPLAIYTLHSVPSLLNFINISISVLYPISMMAQTGSVWITVCVSFERYLAVCQPFKVKFFNEISRAKLILIVICVFSVLYNITRFWEFTFQDGCLRPLLKSDIFYMRFYANWTYFTTMFLIPFCCLFYSNMVIVAALRKARLKRARLTCQQFREHKTAQMLVIVVVVFFVCNFLALVINSIEVVLVEVCVRSSKAQLFEFDTCVRTKPYYFFFAADLNNFMVQLGSSFNFFIYFMFSKRFRREVIKIVRGRKDAASNTCPHDTRNSLYSQRLVNAPPSQSTPKIGQHQLNTLLVESASNRHIL